jgi:hypothetical protein
MDDAAVVAELVSDLHRQIDQFKTRGIKNSAGQTYVPSYYKRELDRAIARGGLEVVEFVRRFVHKPPSDAYVKLEQADSLDLACEALVADESRPYAYLFTSADRVAARKRLAPHIDAIAARDADRRARIDAGRRRLRAEGLPKRSELDAHLRTRRVREDE